MTASTRTGISLNSVLSTEGEKYLYIVDYGHIYLETPFTIRGPAQI